MTAVVDSLPGLSDRVRRLLGDTQLLIDGAWADGEGVGASTAVNPTTGQTVAEVKNASVEQARRAVGAARRAFDEGPWSHFTPRERSDRLRSLATLLDEHRAELLELVVTEVGSPVRLGRAMQVGMPIDNLAWSADMALKGPPGGYEEALLPHLGTPPSMSVLRREPVGVVAAITGYNFPINSAVWKLGPGLAAGCTLVLKPSPRTPLCSLALLRLVDRAGFPPGVVNLVFGEADVAEVLTSDPAVDMVMFTGSLPVGRKVMAAAAQTTKRVVLELGGKSASIVLPGVDVDEVASQMILRFCRLSGQACGATTRALVPRDLYEEFAGAGRSFIVGLAVGDPWDDATEIGPLIRSEHRHFVENSVDEALSRGAVLEGGGGRPNGFDDGFFMNPVLVGGVTNDDPICRDELFGPVGALLPYDSVDEAIGIANDSDYGLHAAVFGPHLKALEVATRVRTGSVAINGGGFMRPEGPWGGFKQSGFGREMGDDGFREFFQVKHVQWPIR